MRPALHAEPGGLSAATKPIRSPGHPPRDAAVSETLLAAGTRPDSKDTDKRMTPDSIPISADSRRTRRAAAGTTVLALAALIGADVLQDWRSRTRLSQVTEGAATLAREGVLAFNVQADQAALMEIPVGADSMVMAARVSAGTRSSGTWAVRIAHIAPASFQLKATGRLVAGRTSVICSFRVALRMDDGTVNRPHIGITDEPLCNGSLYRTANLVRTQGS